MAISRIIEERITGHTTVLAAALRHHRVGQEIELRLRKIIVRSFNAGIYPSPELAEHEGGPINSGKGARYDAVVIFRKALRFHQSVMAALGAAIEVRKIWQFLIERLDDHFCRNGRNVL